MILKSETYHFHRLDLTRQTGFIVTVYDEDGLRLAATMPASTPAEAFKEAQLSITKSRDRRGKSHELILSTRSDGGRIPEPRIRWGWRDDHR